MIDTVIVIDYDYGARMLNYITQQQLHLHDPPVHEQPHSPQPVEEPPPPPEPLEPLEPELPLLLQSSQCSVYILHQLTSKEFKIGL